MRAACFIDTNVLLHRASTYEVERPKRAIADALLRRSDSGLSAQVLAEFYHNAISKPGVRMAPELAATIVETLSLLPVVPITAEIVQSAIRLQQRYELSYWDGAILAAARNSQPPPCFPKISHTARPTTA